MRQNMRKIVDKEEFVRLFVEDVGVYMYEHYDFHDFSQGMEKVSDKEIREIAEDLYESVTEKDDEEKENKEK